jgi:SAM-dependent methyltransferase
VLSLSRLAGDAVPAMSRLRAMPWYDGLDLTASASGDLAPWMNAKLVEAAMAGGDDTERSLMSLFLLGEPVTTPIAEEALGRSATQVLLAAGALRSEAGKVLSDYLFVRVDGLALFASRRAAGRSDPQWRTGEVWDPWLGSDSVMLARLLGSRRPRTTLDLGCGTGVLGLRAAVGGSDVVAVDINDQCVEATRFNAALNELGDRVTVLERDLKTLDLSQRFDLVLCNPPFFPVPIGSLGFTAGEAGLDGLEVVRQVVERLPDQLAPGGEALMVAAGYGDEDGPFIVDELDELLYSRGLTCRIFLLRPIPARWSVMAVRTHPRGFDTASLSREVGAYIRSIGATHYHPFVISISAGTADDMRVVRTGDAR